MYLQHAAPAFLNLPQLFDQQSIQTELWHFFDPRTQLWKYALRNKLSAVRSFMILCLGKGLISFNEDNRANVFG